MTLARAQSAIQVFSSENDIGNFGGVPLTDADRRKVLFNCWSPPSGFSFPYVTAGALNRSFQKQWLNEYTWLAYSNIYNVAFCKWCVVFAPQTVSRSAKPPGSLVSGPHCNYKKAKKHYKNHQNQGPDMGKRPGAGRKVLPPIASGVTRSLSQGRKNFLKGPASHRVGMQ